MKGVFCTEETLTMCAANVCLFQSSSGRRTLYDGERIPEIVQTKHGEKDISLVFHWQILRILYGEGTGAVLSIKKW